MALYYQFKALRSLYPTNNEFTRPLWEDNKASYSGNVNIYQQIFDIVNSEKSYLEQIEALAEINTAIVCQTKFGNTNFLTTYDEFIKWEFLKKNTNFAIDYMEAFGNFFARGEDGSTGERAKAIEEIHKSYTNGYDIKVLLNQAHKEYGGSNISEGTNYYGTDGNDELSAEHLGSQLGSINGREVLWGGKGDDILKGGMSKDFLLGGDDNDKIYGRAGDDTLAGNQGNDILYGGLGNDTLYGGNGHDRLYGGENDDTYFFHSVDENGLIADLIDDTDGTGSLRFEEKNGDLTYLGNGVRAQGEPENTFKNELNENIWYRFQPATDDRDCSIGSLFIYYGQALVTVVKNFNKSGPYLGISLTDNHREPTGQDKITINSFDRERGRYITIEGRPKLVEIDLSGDDRADVVQGGLGDEKIILGGGDDWASGGVGFSIIEGGAGNDYLTVGMPGSGTGSGGRLTGGADQDMIIGGSGDDILIAGESMHESGTSETSGDIVAGGGGNDRIYGSRDRDLLTGGSGADYLEGNGGADAIFGDMRFESAPFWQTREGLEESVTVDTGGNVLFGETYFGERYRFSGWEMEIIPAPGGSGYLYDYGTINKDQGSWILDTNATATSSNDIIFGGAGNDYILGQVGNDIIDGGADDDLLYGDGYIGADRVVIDSIPDQNGLDLNGDDLIFGGRGSDTLYGGSGNDLLYADSSFYDEDPTQVGAGDLTRDWLDGGEGNDHLYGGTGRDVLIGGEGHDRLYAGACALAGDGNELQGGQGNDVLISNQGQHLLMGGTGQDTYVYSSETMLSDEGRIDDIWDHYDSSTPGGSDGQVDWVLIVDGHKITRSMIKIDQANRVYRGEIGGRSFKIDIIGNDYIFTFVDDDDQAIGKKIHIHGGLLQAGLMSEGGLVNRVDIGGSMLLPKGTLSDDFINGLLHGLRSRSGSGLAIETLGGHDRVLGSEFADYIDGGEGHDDLMGFGGNDQIFGRSGDDYLAGLDGDDTLDGGSGNDRLEGGEGNDTLTGGEGEDVLLGGSGDDSLDGGEGDDLLQGGEGSDIILGGAGADEIYGEAGDDEIHGGEGNDYLDGGEGDDRLEGGAGDDVYVFGQGYGHDTILDQNGENGILFDGLNRDDIELLPVYDSYTDEKEAYDLIIRVKATGETLTIINGIMAQSNADRPHKETVVQFADDSLFWLEDLFDPGWDLPEITEVSNEDQIITGDDGNNTLKGGSGHDYISGGKGNDTIYGLAGNDQLQGNRGNDILYGGSGSDTIYGDNRLVIPVGEGDAIYVAHDDLPPGNESM